MLSIITTVYNQAGMNRLFYERLVRNTTLPYELIVVDNGSTDGSLEFFRERADVMIENGANYSYPYCQNRGFARAQYDVLVFINNDVLVPRGWDVRLLEVMQREKLDAITPATNDHLESVRAQKKLNNRWKRVKYPLRFLFGTGYANLKLMAALTYRNLDRFADERYRRFGTSTVEGFSGSCMVLTRRAMDLMGGGIWDERIQQADFDCFCTIKERSLTHADIRPVQVALGVYIHHYQRLTFRSSYPPFADRARLITLQQKWQGREKELLQDVSW